MTDKLASIVPKLLPLLRMLGSGADGEIVNSVREIRRIPESTGADIHALVDQIEKPALSMNELRCDFECGRAEVSTATSYGNSNGVGKGVDGYSSPQIGEHLQANAWRMTGFKRQFSEGIARRVRYRVPSAKQAGIMHQIFVNRFGGRIT